MCAHLLYAFICFVDLVLTFAIETFVAAVFVVGIVVVRVGGDIAVVIAVVWGGGRVFVCVRACVRVY